MPISVNLSTKTELCSILDKQVSDKSLYHNYSKIYSTLFSPLKDNELNLLEIGLGTVDPTKKSSMASWQVNVHKTYQPGNSLRAWKEFFPKSHIQGCDIDPSTMFEEDRIQTFVLDQLTFTQQDIEKLPLLDIIIDDGLHRDDANMRTWTILQTKLKNGGLYIVEDLHAKSTFAKFRPNGGIAEFVCFPEKGTPSDNYMWIFQKNK